MPNETTCMQTGDFIVIQRQNYMKLHKLKSNGSVSLGKDQVELENIIGKPYFSTFRMVTRPKNRRVYTLEPSKYINSIENLNIDKSGVDNRNIIDDGKSQQLSKDEIVKLRDNALSSSDIVGTLISNSKTFGDKTEYSQEKYLKKKEKKYFEYIQIHKPTIRLIADIYYKQDPGKVQGIRIDDLSQILAYSNVQDNTNILLYDSGTNGLLTAAITERIGENTEGLLIHMHPGNVCQKEAFSAMQFSSEQSSRCVNVCLYSVLRCFYQTKESSKTVGKNNETIEKNNETVEKNNETIEKNNETVETNNETVEKNNKTVEENNKTTECITDKNQEGHEKNRKRKLDDIEETPAKRPCWQIDNELACKYLKNKVDSLIIVAKEHPSNIVKELLQFLNCGRPFVVFSLLRESLETLYIELKNRLDIVSLRLCSTMMRNYQVLPNRTHPDVSMNCGGYILTGFKIDTKSY